MPPRNSFSLGFDTTPTPRVPARERSFDIAGGRLIACRPVRALFLALALAAGCGSVGEEALPSAEPLSRTEFTDLIENFFEYEPLQAGRPSRFRIHLTELAEGTPVAGADVALKLLAGSKAIAEARAQPGSVAGIYLAELTPSAAGAFDVVFQVRTEALDETMRVPGFSVQE